MHILFFLPYKVKNRFVCKHQRVYTKDMLGFEQKHRWKNNNVNKSFSLFLEKT